MRSSDSKFTYVISTMGCKANLADSQELESRLQNMGGVPAESDESSDLMVLNTCTVTDQADKEAKNILRKSKAKFTVATGCLAQVSPDVLEESGSALKIVRNSAKGEFESIIAGLFSEIQDQQKIFHGDRANWHQSFLENSKPGHLVSALSGKTRAFYKFQDGCNAFCSYCVIPLARGRSRSLPFEQVVSEIQALVDSGIKEVALTAIHAADYESAGLNFVGLVEKILNETSVQRLRMTSLDPAEIPDSLLELMEKNARLCPHFHVSLQSANSKVLQSMKRAYDATAVEDRLRKITELIPHAYVGMDVIAGFPTETEAEFQDSLERLRSLPWTKAHVFPFSVRRNTAAARLVESGITVNDSEIHRRAKLLRDLSEEKFTFALQSKVGSVQEVLVEEKKVKIAEREFSFGHARNFHKVLISGKHEKNQLKKVRIIGFAKDYLKGELV